ncbi:MAG: 50S ribosome-binding GTPase, partial [Chloroflexi bacterium]|nr:50S ribosome-binding GTPase [Chloroflexota bacterium]
SVTRAHPKIAAYPFTTLEPYLGIAMVGDRTFAIADIPGLIEGAHEGVGLGHDFLRHIQRTRLLLHLVDGSGQEGRDPLEDIRVIEYELEAFDPELIHRPRLLVINKSDLPETTDTVERVRAAFGTKYEVFLISAATHHGLEPLLNRVAELLDRLPPTPHTIVPSPKTVPSYMLTPITPNLLRCEGPLIDRLVAQTDFRERDAIERLRQRLIRERIPQAAARSGMSHGEIQVGPAVWRLEESRIFWSRWEDEDATTATPG